MKVLLLFSILVIASCSHPESSKFSRNKSNLHQTEKTDNANEEILNFEIENGVKYVWIEINGMKLRFVFDTGASNVCISKAEAFVLFRQGTLTNEDIKDVAYFQDATGQISEGTKINLKEVKIGGQILLDVEALVVDNMNSPLLLGQSVLERFGEIEINNNNNTIILKN